MDSIAPIRRKARLPRWCTSLFYGSHGFHSDHIGSNCQVNSPGRATPFCLPSHPQTKQLFQPHLPLSDTKGRSCKEPSRKSRKACVCYDIKPEHRPKIPVFRFYLILLKFKLEKQKWNVQTMGKWLGRRKQINTGMVTGSPHYHYQPLRPFLLQKPSCVITEGRGIVLSSAHKVSPLRSPEKPAGQSLEKTTNTLILLFSHSGRSS